MKARLLITLPKSKTKSIADVAWNLPFGTGDARYHKIGLLMRIEMS
jgi:hypothetical protein